MKITMPNLINTLSTPEKLPLHNELKYISKENLYFNNLASSQQALSILINTWDEFMMLFLKKTSHHRNIYVLSELNSTHLGTKDQVPWTNILNWMMFIGVWSNSCQKKSEVETFNIWCINNLQDPVIYYYCIWSSFHGFLCLDLKSFFGFQKSSLHGF